MNKKQTGASNDVVDVYKRNQGPAVSLEPRGSHTQTDTVKQGGLCASSLQNCSLPLSVQKVITRLSEDVENYSCLLNMYIYAVLVHLEIPMEM